MFDKIARHILMPTVLALILSGNITTCDQLKGEVDPVEHQQLSGVMEIENGNKGGISDEEDIMRLLDTGSVVLHRKESSHWSGDTIEEVIMAKGQYAPVTRNNFKTKQATERTKMLAKFLLLYGTTCPRLVVYQGQSFNGSKEYKRYKVKGDKDEIFCYE